MLESVSTEVSKEPNKSVEHRSDEEIAKIFSSHFVNGKGRELRIMLVHVNSVISMLCRGLYTWEVFTTFSDDNSYCRQNILYSDESIKDLATLDFCVKYFNEKFGIDVRDKQFTDTVNAKHDAFRRISLGWVKGPLNDYAEFFSWLTYVTKNDINVDSEPFYKNEFKEMFYKFSIAHEVLKLIVLDSEVARIRSRHELDALVQNLDSNEFRGKLL